MAFRPLSTVPAPAASPSPIGKDAKWLLASHLQKAIRRGLADEAAWAAETLCPLDYAYLRYRLAVIAAEDVAGGSPGVVAEWMGPGWTKKEIQARGGLDCIVAAVRAFAAATKDRTPCTWMGCVRELLAFEAQHGPWANVPIARAMDLAWDPSRSWAERGLAAWRAVGTDRFPSERLPTLAGDWAGWQAQVAARGASPERLAALAAGARQREAHPVFLALAWDAQDREGAIDKAATVLDLGKAGPWLSAAVDKHTREGLSALRALTGSPDARRWGAERGLDSDGLTDAVGRLWFWMEGGQVSRTRAYPTAVAMETAAKRAFLARTGLDGRALYGRFGAPAPLAEARRRAVGAPLTQRPHP